MKDISAVSGRRRKSEPIDISNTSLNFDLPNRDPARIPSISRPLSKPKSPVPITGVPPQDKRLKVEQELAVASSRPIPPRPLPPSQVPHKESKEERPKQLSELLG